MNDIVYISIYNKLSKLTQKIIKVISQKTIPKIWLYIPINNSNIDIPNPKESFQEISGIANQWIDWPELKPLIDEVNKNEELKSTFFINTAERVKNNPIENKHYISTIFSIFISDYLDEAISEENFWNEIKFLEMYKHFELSILQKKCTLIAWIPFYYFEFDKEIQSDEILLENGVSFVNLNIIDRKYFYSSLKNYSGGNWQSAKYFLKFLIKKDINIRLSEDDYRGITEIVYRLLLSIRLIVGGDAKFNEVIFTPKRGEFSSIRGITIRGRGYTPGGKTSIVSEDKINDILHYKDVIQNIENDYQIPLSRYAWISDRVMKIDKLIDLAVSLESLLLTPSKNSEISFKLATRGAWLLENGFENRKKWYKKFKEIYDFRSRIVHGSNLCLKPEEQKKLDEKIDDAQQAVAGIFKIIIGNQKLYERKNWNKILENITIAGNTDLNKILEME